MRDKESWHDMVAPCSRTLSAVEGNSRQAIGDRIELKVWWVEKCVNSMKKRGQRPERISDGDKKKEWWKFTRLQAHVRRQRAKRTAKTAHSSPTFTHNRSMNHERQRLDDGSSNAEHSTLENVYNTRANLLAFKADVMSAGMKSKWLSKWSVSKK